MFWHQPEEMPERLHTALQQTQAIHPGFELVFGHDRAICTYLSRYYPAEYLQLYQANQIAASRSDLARLILLYAFGGVYCDVAMVIQQAFDDWLRFPLVLVRRGPHAYRKQSHIINGLIAAPPGHPLILLALEQAFFHLRHGLYNHDVGKATGAYCLNLALQHPYCSRMPVQFFDFESLHNQRFVYWRDPAVSNRWLLDQTKGILPTQDT